MKTESSYSHNNQGLNWYEAKCGCLKATINCINICNVCHSDCLYTISRYVDQQDEEAIVDSIIFRKSSNATSTSTDDVCQRK